MWRRWLAVVLVTGALLGGSGWQARAGVAVDPPLTSSLKTEPFTRNGVWASVAAYRSLTAPANDEVCAYGERTIWHSSTRRTVLREESCARPATYSFDPTSWTGHVTAQLTGTLTREVQQWSGGTWHLVSWSSTDGVTGRVDLHWQGWGDSTIETSTPSVCGLGGYATPRPCGPPPSVSRNAWVTGEVRFDGMDRTLTIGSPAAAGVMRFNRAG